MGNPLDGKGLINLGPLNTQRCIGAWLCARNDESASAKSLLHAGEVQGADYKVV